MSTDSLVSSLPALRFGEPPAITWERFVAECGGEVADDKWPLPKYREMLFVY